LHNSYLRPEKRDYCVIQINPDAVAGASQFHMHTGGMPILLNNQRRKVLLDDLVPQVGAPVLEPASWLGMTLFSHGRQNGTANLTGRNW
jgi:hypothetical protein